MGNGEAKELTCTTHGREVRGVFWRERGYQVEGGQRGKKLGQL